jgi:hypothetical protein
MNVTITKLFLRDGSMADPDSVALSDADATYGVRHAGTLAVVVAAGQAMTRDAAGSYSYTFDGEAGETYEYTLAVTVGTYTTYVEETITAGAEGGEITLTEAADWLKIEDEDAYPALMVALIAAEAYVRNWTGLSLADCTDDQAPLWRVAALSLAGTYHENREAVAPIQLATIPYTLQAILDQLRGPVV